MQSLELHFKQFDYELISRGFTVRDWSEWVEVCKYRFVHPERRRGLRANYAERLRGAEAGILPLLEPIAIYYSRYHSSHNDLPVRLAPTSAIPH